MCHVIGPQGPPGLLTGRLWVPEGRPRPAPLLSFTRSPPMPHHHIEPNSCPLKPSAISSVFFLQSPRNSPVLSRNIPEAQTAELGGE